LAREFCHQHSLPSIGRFCGRDHTTILHGCREGKKLPAYPELARQVRAILDNRAKEPKS
jgi:chromosomal replication initiation ATPase DnaA